MINVREREKDIDSIKRQLHNTASNPPREDPFTWEGREAWSEWSGACRELESELRSEGEYF